MRISAGVQTCALPIWSWRVSAAALAIGTAAYRHWDWITDMRQTLHADAAALDAVLARHGFMAIGDCPLFRLIQTEQAAVLFDNLARHEIGRAPCRERVCQYVLVPVVDGSLKKKKEKT